MSSAKFSWSRAAFQHAASRASRQAPPQAASNWLGPELEKEDQHIERPARDEPEVVSDGRRRRTARLVVHPEEGAGIEVSFVPLKGFLVANILPTPGQPELQVDDVMVAAGGQPLNLAREDEADEVLANAIVDGVELEVEGSDLPTQLRSDNLSDSKAPQSELLPSCTFLGDSDADALEKEALDAEEYEPVMAPNPDTLPLVTSFVGNPNLRSALDSPSVVEAAVECVDDDQLGEVESGGSSDSEVVQSLPQGLLLNETEVEESADIDAPGAIQDQPATVIDETEASASIDEVIGEASGVSSFEDITEKNVPLPSCFAAESSSTDDIPKAECELPKAHLAIIEDAIVDALLGSSASQVDIGSSPSLAALSSTLCAVGLPSETSTADGQDENHIEDGSPDAPLPQLPSKLLANTPCPLEATPNTNAEAHDDLDGPPPPRFSTIAASEADDVDDLPPPRFFTCPKAPEVIEIEPQERLTPVLKLEKVSLSEPSPPLNLAVCLPGQRHAPQVPSSSLYHGISLPEKGRCKVHDLWDWLCELRLQEYYAAATTWCIDMGAANLEELAENIDDLIEALALKPIERQRVQKWAAQALLNGSCGYGWGIEATIESHTSSCSTASLVVDTRSLAHERDHSSPSSAPSAPIYTPRSVRLAMDSRGSTGLTLNWYDEWGILVEGIDPLPGQPGLKKGDFIVAIDGCSLRHRTHEECDAIFTERLQDGAVLSIVTPTSQEPAKVGNAVCNQLSNDWPENGSKGSPLVSLGKSGLHRFPRAPSQATGQLGWKLGKGGPRRGRTGGYDANSMWRRFRGPVW